MMRPLLSALLTLSLLNSADATERVREKVLNGTKVTVRRTVLDGKLVHRERRALSANGTSRSWQRGLFGDGAGGFQMTTKTSTDWTANGTHFTALRTIVDGQPATWERSSWAKGAAYKRLTSDRDPGGKSGAMQIELGPSLTGGTTLQELRTIANARGRSVSMTLMSGEQLTLTPKASTH